MANKKIRELETGSLSSNNDYFVVATNGGDTVKIPYSALATFMFENSLTQGDNISIVDATQQSGIKRYSISADNDITVSNLLTLTVAGWSNNTQTISFVHDTSRRNVIDITLGENAAWDEAGVYPISETANDITFECSTVPDTALTFRVTSMGVS